jgi:DNA polymerase-3 subunit epsilon/ATP-dependent DNA helicase DinG
MLRGLANERGGLIGNLAGALRNSDVPPNIKRDVQNIFSDVAQDVDRALHGVYDFFNALEKFLSSQEQLPGESESPYDRQIRLTPSRRSNPEWSGIEIVWEQFGTSLMKVRDGMEKIYNAWTELDNYEVPNQPEHETELAFAMHRVSETRVQLEALVTKPQASGIYWANIDKKNGNISLHVAPLYVGDLLQKQLFAGKDAVVLTSATLRVGKSFDYIKTRLGIGDWADELAVGSPFDYAQAAMVYVPTDIPEPGQQGYQKAVEAALIELLRAMEGRTLVLFTSHSQLQTTYRAITRPLEEDGIIVIAQNLDGSRRQVLETFKTQERTVLLGTKSFWEGVDVVGEALSCLAITRLPFSVPSDPIFAARSETFEDSFAQYAVPEAVLRFRQGFGRLIRSKNDRGIVIVLDKRVLTKNYGHTFIDSLPPVSKYQGSLKEMPAFAAKWIEKNK